MMSATVLIREGGWLVCGAMLENEVGDLVTKLDGPIAWEAKSSE